MRGKAMSLHHELFLMKTGLDQVRILPDMSAYELLLDCIHADIATAPPRRPLGERLGAAMAAAFDDIMRSRLGPDVDAKELNRRIDIVQKGLDGDYNVIIDGEVIGIIGYPDGRNRMRYAVIPKAGLQEVRTIEVGYESARCFDKSA